MNYIYYSAVYGGLQCIPKGSSEISIFAYILLVLLMLWLVTLNPVETRGGISPILKQKQTIFETSFMVAILDLMVQAKFRKYFGVSIEFEFYIR